MEYKTKTNLILPFKGELMVSNGGRSPDTNNHNKPPDKGSQSMLYAYDFREDHHIGDGKKLEDYYAFGKEVLAPANGKIIQVISGAIDMKPGEVDRSVGIGNAIIIDHENGEFSLLCHFKEDSVKVKVGDSVKQGDVVGLCGNTGNTSEPHIHFHLQDGPRMHNSNGLPAQFEKIVVDGELKEKFEPVRFQRVSNPQT